MSARAGAGVGEPGRAVNPLAMPEGVRFPPRPSFVPKKGNLANLALRSRLESALTERDGPDCFYCGRTRDEVWRAGLLMAIDHVVPRPDGSDDIDNLVWACSECNIRKCLQPGWFFMLKELVVKLADAPRNILVSFGRFRLHDFAIQQRSLPEPPYDVNAVPERAGTLQHVYVLLGDD